MCTLQFDTSRLCVSGERGALFVQNFLVSVARCIVHACLVMCQGFMSLGFKLKRCGTRVGTSGWQGSIFGFRPRFTSNMRSTRPQYATRYLVRRCANISGSGENICRIARCPVDVLDGIVIVLLLWVAHRDGKIA